MRRRDLTTQPSQSSRRVWWLHNQHACTTQSNVRPEFKAGGATDARAASSHHAPPHNHTEHVPCSALSGHGTHILPRDTTHFGASERTRRAQPSRTAESNTMTQNRFGRLAPGCEWCSAAQSGEPCAAMLLPHRCAVTAHRSPLISLATAAGGCSCLPSWGPTGRTQTRANANRTLHARCVTKVD